MDPEAALWQALRAQHTDVTRLEAWLDLFLKLAQPRIEPLRSMLRPPPAPPPPPSKDRKSTRLNSSHIPLSRMPSSA